MKDNQLESVLEALNNIGSGLDQGIGESFFAPLLATFLGAFFAYMFAIRQSNKEEKQRATSILARDLALEIADADAVCGLYWSADRDNNDTAEEQSRATRLKSKFLYVSRLSGEFTNRISQEGSTSEIRNALLQFYETGYDVATGDDFESADRKANHSKIKDISQLSSKARTLLTRYF